MQERSKKKILMAAERKPSFLKVLQGDQFSSKLNVPSDFLGHFDRKVPEHCRLRIRTRTWLVDVEMVSHKIYFKNGWKKFVQENGLKVGECLVFLYDGNLEFYVKIFGKNACKKVADPAREEIDSLKSRYSGYSRDREEADSDDAFVEILNVFPPYYQSQYVGSTSGTKRFVHPKYEYLGRRMHIDDDDDDIEELHSKEEDNDREKVEESEEDENEAGSEYHDDFENEYGSEDEEDSDEDEGRSDDSIEILDMYPRFSEAKSIKKASGLLKTKLDSVKAKAQSSRTCASGLSSNQKSSERKYKVPKNRSGSNRISDLTMALQKASDFISTLVRPACLIAMSPSYVHGTYVHFPSEFAIKHLGKHCRHIFLQFNDQTWCLGIYYVHQVVRMQAGWNKFLNATKLKVGDVCVFELTDSNRYVFDVTIFRTTEPENGTLPGNGKAGVQFKSRN